MKLSPRTVFCLILVLTTALAGCSGGNTTITIIEDSEQTASDVYSSTDFYAPDDTAQYYEPDESVDVSQQAAPSDQVIIPSQPNTYADVTYGVVVGADAGLNPLNCTYTDIFAVNELVFESVVELDENLKPQPLLAERWSAENRDWTFTLRSGVKFHSGQTLSALDVVASYNRILENRSSRWYLLVSQLISGMTATDDNTLVVRSAGQGYMFLYAMTFPVLQRDSLDSELAMGTGPFWYSSYQAGQSVRLERNPLWWKRFTGSVQSINVLFYRNSRAALTGLDMGEIDLIATDYPTAALNRGLTDRSCIDYSTQTYECIVPNLKSNRLSDVRVRQAIMYAIDRTTICDTVFAGMAQESEVPVIPGSWLYDPQSAKFNYNPERALQLLYEAGWYDKDSNGILEKEINGVTLNLSMNLITCDRGTTSARSEAAALIAKQLRRVGIEVKVLTGTNDELKSALQRGNFDMALCAFELSEIPNLAFMLAGAESNNFSSYDSKVMDGYLAKAYNAPDSASLVAAMSEVQMQIVEDLPVLGLFFRAGVLVNTSTTRGFGGTRQYDVLRGMTKATTE